MMSSTHFFTFAWPIRSWICLSNRVSIGIGSAIPPYTPLRDTVPPRRTMSIAEYSALQPVETSVLHQRRRNRSGKQPGDLVDQLGDWRPMGFHADRVDDRV